MPEPAKKAGLTIHSDVDLRSLNTFGVPARAHTLIELTALDQVDALIDRLGARPPLILGGGSNVLLTRDPPQPVLRVRLERLTVRQDADAVIVEVGAGHPWHRLVEASLAMGLQGLENLALIPGSAGAAPIQNIGAYGVELADRFESLDAIALDTGERRRFDRAACRFGYRDSVFKQAGGARWLVLTLRLRLRRAETDAPLALHYPELAGELSRRGIGAPSARQLADCVIAIRSRKLPDPAHLGNAGSFFKNPLVSTAKADALAAEHPNLPRYRAGTAETESVKLSAGWLIEQCGWRGYRAGDAGVSAQHALVLVNHGHATGAQLAKLAERIRQSVRQRFSVDLEPEPVIV